MHAYFYQNLSTAPKPPFRRHPFPWWSRLSLSSTVSLHRLTTVLTGRNFLSTAFVFALKPLFSSGMRLRGGRARGSLISIPGQLCPLSRASHPFSTDSIHLFRGSPFRKTTPLFATVLCRSFDLLTKGFSREREREEGRCACRSFYPKLIPVAFALSRRWKPCIPRRVCTTSVHHAHAHAYISFSTPPLYATVYLAESVGADTFVTLYAPKSSRERSSGLSGLM